MKLITIPRTFTDLKQSLELCDELFLQHQIHLMHQDIKQAVTKFEQLVSIRTQHLKIMEELLLPAFEEIVENIPYGAKPLYFIREKKLILKNLDKYIRKLGNIFLHSERLEIVRLFEEYAWLKDLLDHHDAREKAFLFTILDEKLPDSTKQELLQDINKRFKQLEKSST